MTLKRICWQLTLGLGLIGVAASASAGLFGPKGSDVDEKKANVRKQPTK